MKEEYGQMRNKGDEGTQATQEAVYDANKCCCSHLLGEAEAETLANGLGTWSCM